MNDTLADLENPIRQLEFESKSWSFDAPLMEDIDSWTYGVIIADERGELTFANRRALELHGQITLGARPSDYSVFHGLFTEQGSPYPSESLPLALTVSTRQTIRHAKWLIRRPDASRILVIGDALPLTNARGQHAGGILVFRQII